MARNIAPSVAARHGLIMPSKLERVIAELSRLGGDRAAAEKHAGAIIMSARAREANSVVRAPSRDVLQWARHWR